jgi:hypothetical protein
MPLIEKSAACFFMRIYNCLIFALKFKILYGKESKKGS